MAPGTYFVYSYLATDFLKTLKLGTGTRGRSEIAAEKHWPWLSASCGDVWGSLQATPVCAAQAKRQAEMD